MHFGGALLIQGRPSPLPDPWAIPFAAYPVPSLPELNPTSRKGYMQHDPNAGLSQEKKPLAQARCPKSVVKNVRVTKQLTLALGGVGALARMIRAHLKVPQDRPVGTYHCVSRIVDRVFRLKEVEKEHFMKLRREYEEFCEVRALTT
jgi:hypothetical protein